MYLETNASAALLNSSMTPNINLKAFFFSLENILVLTSNMLVVILYSVTRELRTKTNSFMLSLSVADLLVGILVLPLAVIKESIGSWQLGQALCDFWVTCDVLLCTASILNLCCISIDRYFGITMPLWYKPRRTAKHVWATIALAWIISMLIAFPPIFGWQDKTSTDPTKCTLPANRSYIVYSALGSFYLPLLIMLCAYALILVAVWKQGNALRAQEAAIESTELMAFEEQNRRLRQQRQKRRTQSCGELQLRLRDFKAPRQLFRSLTWQGQRRGSGQVEVRPSNSFSTSPQLVRAQRRERKLLKMMLFILGIFVLCWLPFFIVYLMAAFDKGQDIAPELHAFFNWLGYANSFLNPLIYTFCSQEFRGAFRKLVV